jgi:ATP adenylyltransferase
MTRWFTPWRKKYINGEAKTKDGSCVFCGKRHGTPDSDRRDLIIARSEHVYVILNLFPYATAHCMVIPYEHVGSQEDLPTEALTDIMLTVNRTLAVLRHVYNPNGFNLGVNLGTAAGAGIAAHYHFHIVPRWGGDANFMTTVGGVRVIPDSLEDIYQRVRAGWVALYGG